jgi:bacillithiol system protein YtxJ
VAEITGIQHESPQIVLFKDGKAVFDRDNWDITAESIAEALESHFHPVG